MESIVHKPSINLGGNASIYFIRYSNILNNPRVIRSMITADLQLSGYWTPLDVAPYSIDYSETEIEDDKGTSAKCSVSFVVPQETPSKRAKMKALREERLAVLILDNSTGKFRLVGNNKEFLAHSKVFDSGANPSNLNGSRVRMEGRLKHGAVTYEGAISLDPGYVAEPARLNIGGLSSTIRFCEQSNLLNLANGDIYLIDDWLTIDTIPYSGKLKESEADSTPGFKNKVLLQFSIAQESADLKYKLSLLISRKLIFLLTDLSTGLQYLVGNTKEYMKSDRRFKTGSSPSSLNANQLKFAGQMHSGPVFFDGETITLSIWRDETGEIITDENGEAIYYE